jgi:hypothetical protein
VQIFIRPLREARPPIIHKDVHAFIDTVFGNILDIRECNRRLLEVMRVRQREQQPVIKQIGDIFLSAAAEFRIVYPLYIGQLPVAEKTVKEETESNVEFKNFLEVRALCDEKERNTNVWSDSTARGTHAPVDSTLSILCIAPKNISQNT